MSLAARLPAPLARILLWWAFRLLRLWWLITHPDQAGALVAIHNGGAVLLPRESCQPGWTFPGGTIRAGEKAAEAAVREVREEVGLSVTLADLGAAATITHNYLARRDTMQLYSLRCAERPVVRIDEREIVAARWLSPDDALRLLLVLHARSYLQALTTE